VQPISHDTEINKNSAFHLRFVRSYLPPQLAAITRRADALILSAISLRCWLVNRSFPSNATQPLAVFGFINPTVFSKNSTLNQAYRNLYADANCQ
jgi:hypothetical protein